jgi:hypothetical protein
LSSTEDQCLKALLIRISENESSCPLWRMELVARKGECVDPIYVNWESPNGLRSINMDEGIGPAMTNRRYNLIDRLDYTCLTVGPLNTNGNGS